MAEKASVLVKKLLRRVDKYLTDAQEARGRSTNVFGVWTQNKKDIEKDFIADLKGFTKVAVMLSDPTVLAMCQMQAKKAKEELLADCDSILGEDGE